MRLLWPPVAGLPVARNRLELTRGAAGLWPGRASNPPPGCAPLPCRRHTQDLRLRVAAWLVPLLLLACSETKEVIRLHLVLISLHGQPFVWVLLLLHQIC